MLEMIRGYSDVRNDHGILKFAAGDIFTLPIKFNITVKDENENDVSFTIPEGYSIKINIKSNRRFIENVLEYEYEEIVDNEIMFDLSESDSAQLRAGCEYVLYAFLYNENSIKVLTLINGLIMRVE